MYFIIVLIFLMTQLTEITLASLTEDQLFVLPNKVNYQSAVNLCKAQGMNLVKIQDELSNQMLFNFATHRHLGQYWMDGNDVQREGRWVYSDGNTITYSKWHPGEPNNWFNEDCLQGLFYGNGYWNDIKCDLNLAVICYGEKSTENIVTFEENQLVALPDKVNYQSAINLCKGQGMDLVKVQNEATNQIVYNFAVAHRLGQYWMDANDIQTEGQWVYSNGRRIVYSKWQPGEPNNWFKEDCLHGAYYGNGFWNDIKCDNNIAVICTRKSPNIVTEVETKVEPKVESKLDTRSIYLTEEKGSFEEALQFCKSQNLKPIRIDDAELNMALYKMAVRKGLETYWIDGNDKKQEGNWVDIEGNLLKYKNFDDGKTNSSGDNHCIAGYNNNNGVWKAVSCDMKKYIICYEERI